MGKLRLKVALSKANCFYIIFVVKTINFSLRKRHTVIWYCDTVMVKVADSLQRGAMGRVYVYQLHVREEKSMQRACMVQNTGYSSRKLV